MKHLYDQRWLTKSKEAFALMSNLIAEGVTLACPSGGPLFTNQICSAGLT